MADTYLNILVNDDTGTPSAPNFDGTPLDSTFFADLETILNEMLTRATKTVGGVWTWETPGEHNFTGGGVAINRLSVHNITAGNTHLAALQVQADGAGTAQLQHASSSFVTSGLLVANGARVIASGAGGLGIQANHAAGTIRFAAGGIGETMRLDILGRLLHGTQTSVDAQARMQISGGTDVASWSLCLHHATSGSGQAGINWKLDNTDLWQLIVDGNDANSLRLLYNSAVTCMRFTTSTGQVGIADGDVAKPGLHYISDPNTGMLRSATDELAWVTAGVARLRCTAAGNTEVLTGNLQPNADNVRSLGTASLRWSALHVVDARFNDVTFDNGWSMTEGDKIGLWPGLAFVDKTGELHMFIDSEGTLYVNETRSLSELPYNRTTLKQRLRAL
jgi:hypothetical protein